MSTVQWVKLGTRNCDFLKEEVELMEKRLYPKGILDSSGDAYRVLIRKCSAGYECGHMEDPCQWAEKPGHPYSGHGDRHKVQR